VTNSGEAARRPGISAAAGFGGGFLSGIFGGGGGSAMVPLMTGPLKMSQHVAHGTSLVIITVTALVAAIAYSVHEPISPVLVASLGGGSIAGAFIGARAASRIPAMQLRQLFGVFLIAISLRMLLWESIDPWFDASGAAEAAVGLGFGLIGGVLSGALGVGGGSIFVPALVLGLGVGQHEAQGISLWVVVLASLMGGYTHYRHGTVDMQAARWIAPAALPGAVIGAVVAAFLGGRSLQVVFAIVLTLIGLQMLTSARRRIRTEPRERLAVAADAA
jgi:uncharacterized membrane protein YfcA